MIDSDRFRLFSFSLSPPDDLARLVYAI